MHLIARHLIIMHTVQAFHRKSLPQHLHTVDGAVIKESLYLLTQQLLSFLPYDRIIIHGHHRILSIIHQRITYGLDISAVGSQMAIGMQHTIDTVRPQGIRIHLECIGMGIKGILLREVYQHGTVGCFCISRTVIIETIIAGKHILVGRIGIYDVTKGLAHLVLSIPYHTIPHKAFPLIGQNTSVEQIGLVRLGIIISQLRVDMAFAMFDIGWAHDVSDSRTCIVM